MAGKQINVMHIITGLHPGGAEKAALDICIIQRDNNVSPLVVSITDKDRLLPLFEQEHIETMFLNAGKSPVDFLRASKKVLKLVRERNIDIIHCHMFHPLIFAYVAKVFHPRLKIVFTPQNFNIGGRFRELVVWLTKSLRSADVVFSPTMKFRMYKKKATYIIPNGIAFANYALPGVKNTPFTFINLARFDIVKNHKALVRAAGILKSEGHHFKLWLVGEGVLKEESMQISDELGLKDTVEFLGYRSDIPALLSKSECFILPSLWEGLPVSILEACASGLPIIASATGSTPEFFTSDEILYTKTNPEDIALKMAEMLHDHSFYQARALKVREKVREKFELQVIGTNYIELYKKLLV